MGDGRWAMGEILLARIGRVISDWQLAIGKNPSSATDNEKRRTSYLRRAFSRTVVRSMISLFDSHQRFSHR